MTYFNYKSQLYRNHIFPFIQGLLHTRQAVIRGIPAVSTLPPPQPILAQPSPSLPAFRFLSTSTRIHRSATTKDDISIDDFRRKQEQIEEEFNKSSPITTLEQIRQNRTEEGKAKAEEDEHTNKIRKEILAAAMNFVPTLGWTKEAIIKGAESLGYPGVVHGLFPRGNGELIEYFYTDCTQRLVEWMDKETEGGTKRVPSEAVFISNAIHQRLKMLAPYRSSWPQAIAVMSLPHNAVKSLANLLTLADEICHYSGDRAVDVRSGRGG